MIYFPGIIFGVIGGFFTGYFGIQNQLAWVGLLFNGLLTAISLIGLVINNGWKKTLLLTFFISILAILVESLAIISCFPYGCFNYTDKIGPQIALPFSQNFLAPISLPLAFLPLLLGAYGLSSFIIQNQETKFSSIISKPRIFLSLFFLILLDLLIDPLAVYLGLWKYHNNQGWFGVPWTNYSGWLLSGFIFIYLTEKLLHGRPHRSLIISLTILLSFWISAALTILFK